MSADKGTKEGTKEGTVDREQEATGRKLQLHKILIFQIVTVKVEDLGVWLAQHVTYILAV